MNDISKDYAFSLFALAREEEKIEAYSDALKTVDCILEDNPSYPALIHSPALSLETRLGLLDEAFGFLPVSQVLSFLKLMCEKGHFLRVRATIGEFFALKEEAERRVPVLVISSAALSDEQKERLTKKIKTLTEKEPDMNYKVDESVIGGIQIRIEDRVIDGTLSGKLSLMKGVLKS